MVTFDSVSTYYIGVYFSGEHHLADYPYESGDYCCINHYVWVRFDSFEEIEREFNTLVNNEENLRISREILDILRSSTTANSAEDDEEENEVIERVKNPFFRNLDFENKEQ